MSLCHGQTHDKNKVTDYNHTILLDIKERHQPDIVVDLHIPIDTVTLDMIGHKMMYIDMIFPPFNIFFKEFKSNSFFLSMEFHLAHIMKLKLEYEACTRNNKVYKDDVAYPIQVDSDNMVDIEKMVSELKIYLKKYKFDTFLDKDGKITTDSLIHHKLHINEQFVLNILSLLAVGGSLEYNFGFVFTHLFDVDNKMKLLHYMLGEYDAYFNISIHGPTFHFTKIKELI